MTIERDYQTSQKNIWNYRSKSFIHNYNNTLKNQDRRILIVDDEPINVLCLKQIIQNICGKGIMSIIEEAYDGKEALKKVKRAS